MNSILDLTTVSEEAQRDILELKTRIGKFKEGKEIEDKFKHYRLTRGLYGQRQVGVQMLRTKIPFGKLTTEQLVRLADISEHFTNGNLHLTTRQNVQMHHIKLDDGPAIWKALEEKNITAREACGNTVRNITGSPKAGIDPQELFDISPYVQATFKYFLRNPICQEMGRKIKIAFSSTDKDSAFGYFNDFGFIPRINEKGERGFRTVVGGGLGAQSIIAHTAYEFLPENQLIPFIEASLRVFDRHGERAKRHKARMKFLIQQLGFDGFMALVQEEWKAIKNKTVEIDRTLVEEQIPNSNPELNTANLEIADLKAFDLWQATNVFEQKQKGYFAVYVKLPLGDIQAATARKFASAVKKYASDDIRITINQGFLLRGVTPLALPALYNELSKINLANPGFNSTADVTACPGTDTCNLGVTNSTALATELEQLIYKEFAQLLHEENINIKISGCMNACGQHMAAEIGFHGSSIKTGKLVIPAMQIVLGGGVSPTGEGFIADKVIKIPTKRIPQAVRNLLNDYFSNAEENELFNIYYRRQGKSYFYNLLKPLADKENVLPEEYHDWGQNSDYVQEIGVGECAGVSYDMVSAIIEEAEEKIDLAKTTIANSSFADSIYHSYAGLVIGAKAILLAKDVTCNTHKGIIDDFQTNFVENGAFELPTENFGNLVLQINKNEPSESFAKSYFQQAEGFVQSIIEWRKQQLLGDVEKMVIREYYKA